jgi:hypothetical protein
MSTKAITPRFAESLRLLAASQLQTQVSRSGDPMIAWAVALLLLAIVLDLAGVQ